MQSDYAASKIATINQRIMNLIISSLTQIHLKSVRGKEVQ